MVTVSHKIGIYAGTFDPLHEGHVSFALHAINGTGLSGVWFLPEREPRHKPDASPYTQRAMNIHQAVARYDSLHLLELPESALSVPETLPHLQQHFTDAILTFLVGADVVQYMHLWPDIDTLIASCEFIIGMRDGFEKQGVITVLQGLGIDESRYRIIKTDHSHLSSSAIRSGTNT